MKATTVLPDALDFTLAALEARGALVERAVDANEAQVLLPREAASLLGVPEELRLAARIDPDRVGVTACGLGSPLLEGLLASLRDAVAAASLRLDLPAPRPGQVKALGERVVIRNGLAEVMEVLPADEHYVQVIARWTAEADDRVEGVVSAVTNLRDGAEPEAGLVGWFDPASSALMSMTASSSEVPESVAPWLEARLVDGVTAAVERVQQAVARRHLRDHTRIVEYFTGLATELGGTRRKLDRAQVAARLAQYAAERDAKLAGLVERFALTVTTTPIAVLRVEVAGQRARLRLRRRKAEREVRVALPAGATGLDRFGCEGCLGSTDRPALCDDALHFLCERCAPQATGRIRCPACAHDGARPRG